MRKLDKKQKVLVFFLAILAVGLFGTFVFQMLKVTPAAAHTQVATANGQQTTTTTAKAAPGATTVAVKTTTGSGQGATTQLQSTAQDAAVASPEAPAPTPTMRDPFIPGVADPVAVEAYHKSLEPVKSPTAPQKSGAWNKATAPFVAPLPKPGGFSPTARTADFSVTPLPKTAPEAIAAPTWTMTGVVEGDGGKVAILRDGDQRRMVRRGDMLDSNFRVVEVGRNRVMVAHGSDKYLLPIGGSHTAPASTQPAPTAPAAPQPNTPQDLGAPATPADNGSNPNTMLKLPGGLSLPAIHLPAN
jgi:hypothetical protein